VEVRRLALALEGEARSYDTCFRPAVVAVFHGCGSRLDDAAQARLARWLEDHQVVCAWSAAASGEEADFLERAAAWGVETCAVLPESAPREHCRKAAERAALVDAVAEAAADGGAAEDLARRIATARALARAASWDVPLLTVAAGAAPGFWSVLAGEPFLLRAASSQAPEATAVRDRLRAVLCVRAVPAAAQQGGGRTSLPDGWEGHAARCGKVAGPGGSFFFAWPAMAEAGRAAMDLHRRLHTEGGRARWAFVLHAGAQEPAEAWLGELASRMYPGRIHVTGRFADLAALEESDRFKLCYVGTIDAQAEPLGIRLYHLRQNGAGAGLA